MSQERSQWDILCELARFEDFDVFVRGKELHFQPKPSDTGERYAIEYTPPVYGGDPLDVSATGISFGRSLTIAKGVQVIVTSAHSKHGKSYTATWPKGYKAAAPGTSGANSPLSYRFNKPGLSQEQAQLYARRKYDEIIRHMVTVAADMPADDLLDCTKIVQVRGTSTAWDQDYYPDSVKRSMSMTEGYRMSVTAKNKADDVEQATE
jgi:phage protein D